MRNLAGRAWLGAGLGLVVLITAFAVAVLVDGGGHRRGSVIARQAPGAPATALPAAGPALAHALDRAQGVIDDAASTSRELAAAGLLEQLATRALAGHPPALRRAILAMLTSRAASSMRANLDAASALSRLAAPQRRLPDWRIVQPPVPDVLLGYFRAAESRFRIPWQDLAAIELIETRFGRVQGASPAGARGPMQFMPATWAQYGRGAIDSQRDAILGAARYLAANGAPRSMADALYHYNNSVDYVRAVEAYAAFMRADPRAYYGYYYWQVLFDRIGGATILPVGFPRVRPVPVAPAG